MSGLSPKLPISLDENDGFALNKTFEEMIQQNFKHLILTAPGEKVMDINFGVGIRRYLFELNDLDNKLVTSQIESKIKEQVNKYMTFVEIQEIKFKNSYTNIGLDYNLLAMEIRYKILPLNIEMILNIAEKIDV